MILFFEGYAYKTYLLDRYFINHPECFVTLPKQDGYSKLVCVGYYYNASEDEHIYILPKVFIYKKDDDIEIKAFGEISLSEIEPIRVEKSKSRSSLLSEEWSEDILYRLPLWLYSAIKKYYNKKKDTRILDEERLLDVTASRKEEKNTSQLDIALALDRFFKANIDFFIFCYKESHKGYNKINWKKTVNKDNPIINGKSVFYMSHVNRQKEVDYEEELIVLFHNTLRYIYNNYFAEKAPETDYELFPDKEFERMMKKGIVKRHLRNIKDKYYNKTLVDMWTLLYQFHQEVHMSGAGKPQDDFLIARTFDRVFEDMIDELLSDPLEEDFKNLKDNKTIDHLFLYQNLFNDYNNIYYIGDSKYYKPDKKPDGPARYKQFTYARNIVQMAIDWYRGGPTREYTAKKLNYVDKLTEGYNVTPNFFISGIVQPHYKYTSNVLKPVMNGKHFEEFHVSQWDNRLFDRDTLFALMYDINFLFVLYTYINRSKSNKRRFKADAKEKFRKNFSRYLDETYCFYNLTLKPNIGVTLERAIRECFYDIKGKVFMPYVGNSTLIMALDEANYVEDSNNAKNVISQYFDFEQISLAANNES